MSENQFMAINRLPSKTWYWLKLNETHIRWQDETRPCVTLAENVRAGQADEAKFAAIRTRSYKKRILNGRQMEKPEKSGCFSI